MDHVERMKMRYKKKKFVKNKPEGKRCAERPTLRWQDGVAGGLWELRIKDVG